MVCRILGPLRPPRPAAAGLRGPPAGFRRLLANEVFEAYVGEVQGCGIAFRTLFGNFNLRDLKPPEIPWQNSYLFCQSFMYV